MSVSIDPKKIDHLMTRNVQREAGELRKHLESGKTLRVKFGADPTAPDLHLGHAVPLRKLREFQDLGHKVVFIIGDYTAKVGDPSGKSKTRPMLSDEDVKRNAETYMAQAGKILDLSKTEIRWNGEWFSKMDFNDILKLAAQFTVARMIEREDFANRLANQTDIHMHELLYPMMQAYDSIVIEADVEIGGTDQMFNILAGRDLQRKMGKREQDCLFLGPILVGTDGEKKMSKSLGNYVGVSEAPEEMFGKIMSIPDTAMRDWFLLATDSSAEDVDALLEKCGLGNRPDIPASVPEVGMPTVPTFRHRAGSRDADRSVGTVSANPRDAKIRLAKDIITQYHSASAADKAEEYFKNVFQKKEVPDDVVEMSVDGGECQLVDLLIEAKLCTSKSDARRQIEQGGVKVNGVVVTDALSAITIGIEPVLIQKGKRHFVKILAK